MNGRVFFCHDGKSGSEPGRLFSQKWKLLIRCLSATHPEKIRIIHREEEGAFRQSPLKHILKPS